MNEAPKTNAAVGQQLERYQPHEAKSAQLQMKVGELTPKVQWYEEQLRLSKQKKCGASSEKTPPEQLRFEEALR